MNRAFLSPGERRVLERLPFNEAAFVASMMETFDAHIVPDQEPPRAPKEGESEQQVLRLHKRFSRDEHTSTS